MGEVVQFIPRANPNREEQMIRDARQIYEGIFPTEVHPDKAKLGATGVILTADGDLLFVDTGPSEMNPDAPT